MTTVAHCGGQYVTRQQLDLVPVPPRTETYVPVPHGYLADKILTQLRNHNYDVAKQEFILAKDGQQFFGYYRIERPEVAGLGYGAAVGFRSSYNKSLSVGLSGGSDVFICDNLAFSGEFTFFRRHTSEVMEEIDYKIFAAVSGLKEIFARDDVRFNRYRSTTINQPAADHLIAEFIRKDIVPVNDGTKLIREWYQPSHAEHTEGGNTVWRLFNAATEALKTNAPSNLRLLPFRTMRLQTTLDQFITPEAIAA